MKRSEHTIQAEVFGFFHCSWMNPQLVTIHEPLENWFREDFGHLQCEKQNTHMSTCNNGKKNYKYQEVIQNMYSMKKYLVLISRDKPLIFIGEIWRYKNK